MRWLLLALFLIPSQFSPAQNLDFARSTVAHLSDSSLFGRGYMHDGSQLAAAYIAAIFDSLGVKKMGEGIQSFPLQVNTFPGRMLLKCGNDTLVPGVDFIVNPDAKSCSGSFKIELLDSTDFQSTKLPKIGRDMLALIDMQGINTTEERGWLYDFEREFGGKAPILEMQTSKLMWSVAQEQSNRTIIELADSDVCRKAKTITIDVEALEKQVELRNIIRLIPGTHRDSSLVITAHYDHLGMMGPALFPGASDNATGTAMMLDLAAHFTKHPPKFDIVFIAFAAEEAGLVGSKYYVEHPIFPLAEIQFLINLDLMGSAEKGIAVVNALLYPERMKTLAAINDSLDLLPRIKHRGKAANSDHYFFSEAGVPAIFIYTEGNITAYHDVNDRAEGIDWTRYPEVFTLLVEFISSF